MKSNSLPNKTTSLNRESPIPLYHQLLEIFHEYLIDGTWEAGSWIPSESELAESFFVSKITIRQALLALGREGKLIRIRGKGTMVTNPTDRFSLPYEKLTNTPIRVFDGLEIKIIETGKVEDNNFPPNPLGNQDAVFIRRLCSYKSRPQFFQTVFLPSRVVEKIGKINWENPNLWDVLKPQLWPLSKYKEYIEAILLARYEANELNEKEGKIGLLIERTLFDKNEHPCFFERLISRKANIYYINIISN